jgi:NAD+ synthase (glutamine-hydrolysing)
MKTIRLTLAQINCAVGDIDANSRKILYCIEKAKKLKSDIIIFPELSLSGYPPEDLLLKPHFITKCHQYLKKISHSSNSILAIIGSPYFDKGELFNAAIVMYNKKIIGVYKKIFLPNYGVFDELRYFKPGKKSGVLCLPQGLNIGINICEDIWQANGPASIESTAGQAKIIINISSSPYHAGKLNLREKILTQSAKANKAFIIYCNMVGGQDELVFDGASMCFNPNGRLLCRAKSFEEDLLTLDIPDQGLFRAKLRLKGNSKKTIEYFKLGMQFKEKKSFYPCRKEKKLGKLEEIYKALVFGLRDYCSKNGFKKVALGLSGGIDSSLVATIAVDALGKDNVLGLSLPSQYSSPGTKTDALILAKNLGIKFQIIPITDIYKHYLKLLKPAFNRQRLDITEENLQARIRGNLLMAFSNKFNYLVVTTGNKSELSVGYCTLYGDTVGGFALIKDVPKTLVYKLAGFRNKIEGAKIIPESVFRRAPSAELRKNQTDQDSLPAYKTLDAIIDAYIEKDKSASSIVKKGFSETLVKRVIRMIDRSEYKRRQYAVGVKITPKAFGRDRRMPITNRFQE